MKKRFFVVIVVMAAITLTISCTKREETKVVPKRKPVASVEEYRRTSNAVKGRRWKTHLYYTLNR